MLYIYGFFCELESRVEREGRTLPRCVPRLTAHVRGGRLKGETDAAPPGFGRRMALWNLGVPLLHEFVRGLSTALAVHAGRTACPACAPVVTCPGCPSLTCGAGGVAVPTASESSWLLLLGRFSVGVICGAAGVVAAWRHLAGLEADAPQRGARRALGAGPERRPAGRGVWVIDGAASSG